ncbi:MAG: hypothetical protein ACLFUN_08900 [Desulfobacterales bacterium]
MNFSTYPALLASPGQAGEWAAVEENAAVGRNRADRAGVVVPEAVGRSKAGEDKAVARVRIEHGIVIEIRLPLKQPAQRWSKHLQGNR